MMKKQENGNSFLDVGLLCGDKCLKRGEADHKPYCEMLGLEFESAKCRRRAGIYQGESKNICQCGQDTVTILDLNKNKSYCCNHDWPCEDQGNKIVANFTMLPSDQKMKFFYFINIICKRIKNKTCRCIDK